MKLANEMTFEEKIYFCLEDLSSFSQSCKEIHDISGCSVKPCFIKYFYDKLFSYTQSRSTRLEKSFLLRLYEKYLSSFNIFTAVRHKKFCLEHFKNKQQ